MSTKRKRDENVVFVNKGFVGPLPERVRGLRVQEFTWRIPPSACRRNDLRVYVSKDNEVKVMRFNGNKWATCKSNDGVQTKRRRNYPRDQQLRLYVHQDFVGPLNFDVAKDRVVVRWLRRIPYDARNGDLLILTNGQIWRWVGIKYQWVRSVERPIHDRVVRLDEFQVTLDGEVYRVVDPTNVKNTYVSQGLRFLFQTNGSWQRKQFTTVTNTGR